MITTFTIVGGLLLCALLAWWPWIYVRDADGFGRWRWKGNRSLRVFWKIWRSLENEPRTTDWHPGWRRRLRTAWI